MFELRFSVPVNSQSCHVGKKQPLPGYLPVLLGVNVPCSRTQDGDPCGD